MPSRERRLNFWSAAVALVIAVVGALNSVFGFVQQRLFARHDLTIDIAGVHAVGNVVKYVVVLSNDGDYPEVVAGATSYLRQVVEGKKGTMLWPMRYCFNPVAIPAGKQAVITYSTLYDTQNPDMYVFPSQEHAFIPSINFKVRGHPSGVVSQYADLGEIEKDQFTFRTNKLMINFRDSRPLVVLGPLPVKSEYATPSLCPDTSGLGKAKN